MPSTTRTPLAWGFVALALYAYSLPWLVGPGASLTSNAFDLAEWASLHPVVQGSSPTLLFTGGLRSLLVLLAAFVAFMPTDGARAWGLRLAFVLIVAIALFPPIAFFGRASGDLNYRQQIALSLTTLLAGGIGLSLRLQRWRGATQMALIVAGLLVSVATLATSTDLLQTYHLSAMVGMGGVLYLVLHAGYLILLLMNKRGNFVQVTSSIS